MACRYTSLWLALEVTGDDDWFQFLEAGERSAIFFFVFFLIFTAKIMDLITVCVFSIHELSMALVWLYYGFAMNGLSLKNTLCFC